MKNITIDSITTTKEEIIPELTLEEAKKELLQAHEMFQDMNAELSKLEKERDGHHRHFKEILMFLGNNDIQGIRNTFKKRNIDLDYRTFDTTPTKSNPYPTEE